MVPARKGKPDPLSSFSSRFSSLLETLQPGQGLNPHQQLQLCRLADAARCESEDSLIAQLRRRQGAAAERHPTAAERNLAERFLSGDRLRLAFINDNGFYAGAGIATARQARSFALAGH